MAPFCVIGMGEWCAIYSTLAATVGGGGRAPFWVTGKGVW